MQQQPTEDETLPSPHTGTSSPAGPVPSLVAGSFWCSSLPLMAPDLSPTHPQRRLWDGDPRMLRVLGPSQLLGIGDIQCSFNVSHFAQTLSWDSLGRPAHLSVPSLCCSISFSPLVTCGSRGGLEGTDLPAAWLWLEPSRCCLAGGWAARAVAVGQLSKASPPPPPPACVMQHCSFYCLSCSSKTGYELC